MLTTIFVVDKPELFTDLSSATISFDTYLREHPKLKEPHVRVINLCDITRYLSEGYYCSLLAEARSHQVIPNVKIINELRNNDLVHWLNLRYQPKQETALSGEFVLCMGTVEDASFQKLANKIYQDFTAPILWIQWHKKDQGLRLHIKQVSIANLNPAQRAFCLAALDSFSTKQWRSNHQAKKFRWDLAILVNCKEAVPPSNKSAISRFIKAGEKLGIYAKTITADDFSQLSQFDGLFIRETTAIDHHTYVFSRKAEDLGLVVIDDSTSILRCCNKVFLHDAFGYKNVPSIKSLVINDNNQATLDELENQLAFPMVLKMPEGSFSKGVFKVSNQDELQKTLSEMLQESALILVQKYLFTEYDWRIGVLNGRALYACRYYMAKNHWQIYNHSSKRFLTGAFDTLPTFEVPSKVLKTALKAANVIGNGLYGIDIKEHENHAYVLEVNDNPSIDHGVEDIYLGEELYMQIMSEFLRRLETRGLGRA